MFQTLILQKEFPADGLKTKDRLGLPTVLGVGSSCGSEGRFNCKLRQQRILLNILSLSMLVGRGFKLLQLSCHLFGVREWVLFLLC